jgi:hypothetical protein
MKVISMHKVDATMEAGALPSKALIKGMGQLMGEMRRANALVDGAGLRRSATRMRLRFSGAERTVLKGPYAGGNELPAGIAMLEVRDADEAVDWASRYAKAVGRDAEIEVGPVTEGWDLGLMEKPPNPPYRCLMLHKADAASEAGEPAPAALAELTQEMQSAGVLLRAARLKPSRFGLRMQVTNKKPTVIDGPFTESKELIAGFVLLDVPSLAEAREWGIKFAAVTGDVELDILQLEE